MSLASDADQSNLGLPHPVAFVLGGGGSLGAVQVGMLQALAERRVAPDLVIGASVGSLNGAVIAADPTSAVNRLSHVWAGITRERGSPAGCSHKRAPSSDRRTISFRIRASLSW
jgi:predicted acylesterase/phospholipase RssA